MASSGSKSSDKQIASSSNESSTKNLKFKPFPHSEIEKINNDFNHALRINLFASYIKIQPIVDPSVIFRGDLLSKDEILLPLDVIRFITTLLPLIFLDFF